MYECLLIMFPYASNCNKTLTYSTYIRGQGSHRSGKKYIL